jgi:hypothetical protein
MELWIKRFYPPKLLGFQGDTNDIWIQAWLVHTYVLYEKVDKCVNSFTFYTP